MFCIHKCTNAAFFLFLGHAMQRESRFTRTFRAKDFNNATLGQSPNAKSNVKPKGTGRGGFDFLNGIFPTQLHNRTFTELAFNLCQSTVERFLLIAITFCIHCEKVCHFLFCLSYFIAAHVRQ